MQGPPEKKGMNENPTHVSCSTNSVYEGPRREKKGMGAESNYSCLYQVKNEKSGFNYDSKAHYLIV